MSLSVRLWLLFVIICNVLLIYFRFIIHQRPKVKKFCSHLILTLIYFNSKIEPPEYSYNVEVISWSPRVYLLSNFLSDEECDHFMRLAEKKLERSTVVGGDGL
jgi:hypothetical protein